MRNFIQKIITFLHLYRWLLLLLLPIVVFLIFIISLLGSRTERSLQKNIIPTITPVQQGDLSQTISNDEFKDADEGGEPPELRSTFQNKEKRSDGSVLYTFSSGNPQRPNISIVTSTGNLLFSRDAEQPLASVSAIITSFGEPERVIKGSKFYGQQANIYIYASAGYAFVGDPNASAIFETHHFPKMSVDDYIKKFGNQN
jgi:hypothetical protein